MHADEVLPVLLARRAEEDPNKTFAIGADGTTLTREELHHNVLRWGGVFRDLGLAAGDTVMVMVSTSLEALCAWIGIGWMRGIEVPINTQYRGDMLAYIINDSQASIMLIHADHVEQVREVIGQCPRARTVIIIGHGHGPLPTIGTCRVFTADALLAGVEALDTTTVEAPRQWDISAIVYTSGTTGPSKGVMMPWGQLYTMARWCPVHTSVTEDDRMYAPMPFYHISLKSPVYAMLQSGGSILLDSRFSTDTYWENIVKHGCTVGVLIGGMARMLMLAPPAPSDATNPMTFIAMVPMLPEAKDFEDRFGLRLGTIFGMTEVSTPLLTYTDPIENTATCGRPRPGVDLRLVDENDYEVPVGQIGELIIRTDEPWTMNRGYWNKPEATAEAWRNGWFHTGDAFIRDEDDNYFYVDRYKDAIRRRGENISSVEVEGLVTQHPAVNMAAAIGVPAEHGEEEVKVVITLNEGASVTPDQLVEFLAPRMPRFMLPRYIEIVDELPMTPTLKVRKVELRATGVNSRTWDREAGA